MNYFIYFTSLVYFVFSIPFISIAHLFVVCYLRGVSNEDKWCVLTHPARDILVVLFGAFTWLHYVRILCDITLNLLREMYKVTKTLTGGSFGSPEYFLCLDKIFICKPWVFLYIYIMGLMGDISL